MGNATACHVSNHSKRNVKVFVADKALELDAFIVSKTGDDHSTPPEEKKFSFKNNVSSDIECVRVMASETKEVPWKPDHFLSVFVEDEDDEKICYKKILLNMSLSAPLTVLLYDV
ncbi:unnamed protein product [Scomber scombrus]|uniref:Unnamed protein product n=1 Tax=Scomber scombrus TaxID=13677 RepID=A0AAV1NX75_SCOSC